MELKSDGEWKGGKKEKGTRCSQKPVWWVFETVTHSGTFMVANRLSCLEQGATATVCDVNTELCSAASGAYLWLRCYFKTLKALM